MNIIERIELLHESVIGRLLVNRNIDDNLQFRLPSKSGEIAINPNVVSKRITDHFFENNGYNGLFDGFSPLRYEYIPSEVNHPGIIQFDYDDRIIFAKTKNPFLYVFSDSKIRVDTVFRINADDLSTDVDDFDFFIGLSDNDSANYTNRNRRYDPLIPENCLGIYLNRNTGNLSPNDNRKNEICFIFNNENDGQPIHLPTNSYIADKLNKWVKLTMEFSPIDLDNVLLSVNSGESPPIGYSLNVNFVEFGLLKRIPYYFTYHLKGKNTKRVTLDVDYFHIYNY